MTLKPLFFPVLNAASRQSIWNYLDNILGGARIYKNVDYQLFDSNIQGRSEINLTMIWRPIPDVSLKREAKREVLFRSSDQNTLAFLEP